MEYVGAPAGAQRDIGVAELGGGVPGHRHLAGIDTARRGCLQQVAAVVVVTNEPYRLDGDRRIQAFDVERQIATRAPAVAFFLEEFGKTVLARPVADGAVVVGTPRSARENPPPATAHRLSSGLRTASVTTLSAARSRSGVMPSLARPA